MRAVAPAASLIFEPAGGWSEAIAKDVATIADDTTPLAWYQDQVTHHRVAAWNVYLDRLRVGTVLWRIDDDAGKAAFVVVAAVGWHRHFDLTGGVLPLIEERARRLGCAVVRFHTKRLGLVQVGVGLGYDTAEWVMRKVLA